MTALDTAPGGGCPPAPLALERAPRPPGVYGEVRGAAASRGAAGLWLQNICAFERGLKPSENAPLVPSGDPSGDRQWGSNTAINGGGSTAACGGAGSQGGLSFEQIRLGAMSETTSCDI